MDALWHAVLISFHPDVTDEQQSTIYESYQTLAEDCGGTKAGIIFFKVERNLDIRKNVHLVQIAVFENDAALQRYRTHPKHVELTDVLKKIADWQVGDFNHSASLS